MGPAVGCDAEKGNPSFSLEPRVGFHAVWSQWGWELMLTSVGKKWLWKCLGFQRGEAGNAVIWTSPGRLSLPSPSCYLGCIHYAAIPSGTDGLGWLPVEQSTHLSLSPLRRVM